MDGDHENGSGPRRRQLKWTYSSLKRPDLTAYEAPCVRTIGKGDLSVVYQPIVDLAGGAVFAHEALARCSIDWYANPEVLFGRAVEERFTGRLGRMVRELAVAGFGGERLFLNIHPDELAMRWLVRPDDPINLCDVPLFIEITESATFEYFELCMDVLKDTVWRTGACLVVDDFGSGYSNLKRIIDLEPRVVKLDRALISGLDQNERQQILIRDLVRMFASLGALTVAEGIETRDELEAVRNAGVQLGQGFFLGRPQPSAALSVVWEMEV